MWVKSSNRFQFLRHIVCHFYLHDFHLPSDLFLQIVSPSASIEELRLCNTMKKRKLSLKRALSTRLKGFKLNTVFAFLNDCFLTPFSFFSPWKNCLRISVCGRRTSKPLILRLREFFCRLFLLNDSFENVKLNRIGKEM